VSDEVMGSAMAKPFGRGNQVVQLRLG